jgi:hypothetical protein
MIEFSYPTGSSIPIACSFLMNSPVGHTTMAFGNAVARKGALLCGSSLALNHLSFTGRGPKWR